MEVPVGSTNLNALSNEIMQPAAEDDPDRRIAPRVKVLKRAQILFNNNFSLFDCIVRNISATGALLNIDDSAHLPKEFGVRIGDDRTVRPARLVYRRGPLAGIRFLDYAEEAEEMTLPAKPAAADQETGSADSISKLQAKPLPEALMRNFRWANTF